MSTPIYSLFIGKNNVAANLAYKAMGEEESAKLFEKMGDSLKEVGADVVISCSSAFANEETPFWGIVRFPDLQARIQQVRKLQQIGWTDITDAFTLLGTAAQEPVEVTIPNPIYKLWLIKSTPAGAFNMATMPKGMESLMWEKHDALFKEMESQTVLSCDCYWSNEGYAYFGVDAYPNIEAAIAIQKGLVELGWPRNLDSFTIFGVPFVQQS
jgi:hypothetical protein